MKTSETTSKFWPAFNKAWGEISHAALDSVNPHYGNEYSSLEAVLDAIKSILRNHGLSWVAAPEVRADRSYVLVSQITHDSGEYLQIESPLILAKNDMQGLGSAVSYMRRYATEAMFGMGEKDDDGNKASNLTKELAASFKDLKNHAPQPSSQYVIPFGKYKGKTIAEAGIENVDAYLKWLYNTAEKEGKPLSNNALDLEKQLKVFLANTSMPPALDNEENMPFDAI